MVSKSLARFVAKTLTENRISFADVQRLQREILLDGIGSRGEAELLLDLDARGSKRDPAWTRCLVAMIVDLVVWAERPTGVVDEDTVNWLAGCLRQHQRSRGTVPAALIAREIIEEAQAFENEALLALAGMCRRDPLLRASCSANRSRMARSRASHMSAPS